MYTVPVIEMRIVLKRNNVYFTCCCIVPTLLTSLVTMVAMVPLLKLKNALILLLVNFLLQALYIDDLLEMLPPTLDILPDIGEKLLV